MRASEFPSFFGCDGRQLIHVASNQCKDTVFIINYQFTTRECGVVSSQSHLSVNLK